MKYCLFCMWAGVCGLLLGCSDRESKREANPGVSASATAPDFERLASEHLPNAYRIHPKVISGGLPDGEAGFRDLASLGRDAMPDQIQFERRHVSEDL